ncbi:hypothetical protein [Shimia aestuarii]|uniref:hypothetical protein n=1 Tax=Shimia aestuarii TaxID=254406 RepID=UPI001FB55148|nr:hypothetical protein [Shimia aestuarii]
MKTLKLSSCMLAMLALVACQSTTTPKQSPTPEQKAELEQARADLIKAECALYAEAKKNDPDFDLPEGCEE